MNPLGVTGGSHVTLSVVLLTDGRVSLKFPPLTLFGIVIRITGDETVREK